MYTLIQYAPEATFSHNPFSREWILPEYYNLHNIFNIEKIITGRRFEFFSDSGNNSDVWFQIFDDGKPFAKFYYCGLDTLYIRVDDSTFIRDYFEILEFHQDGFGYDGVYFDSWIELEEEEEYF